MNTSGHENQRRIRKEEDNVGFYLSIYIPSMLARSITIIEKIQSINDHDAPTLIINMKLTKFILQQLEDILGQKSK